MSAKVRNDILKGFKDADQAILSNARCLTEGVNVPSVDCVGLFAPLKSRVSVAQAMGRAMRKVDGKEFGYVLVPVYLESVEDLDTAARRSKFDVVLDVLQTLKEQDEVLAEELRQIVVRKVKGHDDTVGLRDVIFREPTIALNVPLEQLMEAIRVQCIDALLADDELRWQKNYQKTLRRHEEKGDCNVSKSEDPGLPMWQNNQRARRHRSAPHRVKLLNDIPSWVWDTYEAAWQEGYQKTLRRHEEKGDCNVPESEDRELQSWQQNQRTFYNTGRLAPDRVKLLNNIPSWLWDPVEAFWQKNYQKTLRRHEEKGDCNVSKSEDPGLHMWQNNQRRLYKQDKVASDRVKLLNDIPTWVWNLTQAAWQENYQKMVRRHEEKGDCNASKSEERELWQWQQSQRQLYRQGTLSLDRVQLLNEIPTWVWDVHEAFWQKNYQKMVRRHEEKGDCNVLRSEDRELFRWQNLQRTSYKKGEVAPERVKLLNDIPTWAWDPHEAVWQANYQKTLRRHEEKGDCMVPQSEDPELFTWQAQQRFYHRKGELAPERIKLLNDVPSWLWNPVEAAWQENYQKTLRRHEEKGDCCVSRSEDPVLFSWQSIQRRLYKQGILAPHRVKLLNDVPSWLWDRKSLKGFASTRKRPVVLQKAA